MAAAMLVTGLLMLGGAVLLYRMAGERSGRIALGQFALALSLGGQGMAIFGTAETLGGEWLVDRAAFWLGVGVFEVTLYAIVPNRLHRFVVALGAWTALAFALNIALAGAEHYGWVVLPWSLGWLMPLACGVVTVFVLKEHSLAARGEHGRWEPGADATLVFAAGGGAAGHRGNPSAGRGSSTNVARRACPPPWLAGVLTEVVLLLFALCECRRLQVAPRISAAVMVVTMAFAALMVMAPRDRRRRAGLCALALRRRGRCHGSGSASRRSPWALSGTTARSSGRCWPSPPRWWRRCALLLVVRIVMRKMEARPCNDGSWWQLAAGDRRGRGGHRRQGTGAVAGRGRLPAAGARGPEVPDAGRPCGAELRHRAGDRRRPGPRPVTARAGDRGG